MSLLRMLSIACAAAVFCVACGSGAGPELAGQADTDASPSPVVDAATQQVESDGAGQAQSGEAKTLDDYLGLSANLVRGGGRGGGQNFDEDQALEQQQLVQQEIQICMQAQGFVYVPEETGTGLRFFLATEQTAQTELEFAQSEGFGISTRFDSLLERDIDLGESTSPNDEHLATLGDGEADAWEFALRGAEPERNAQGQRVDPETGEVIQGRQDPGGCTGAAQQTVRGDAEALAELAQDFDELEERIAADPRVTEIARAWADCMRADGFDFEDVGEARAEINQEFRPLLRSLLESASTDGDQGQGAGRGPGNRLQAIAGLELSSEQELELRALQDRERTLATAAVVCQGDTAVEVGQIQARYEAEFVDTNRAALEALSS